MAKTTTDHPEPETKPKREETHSTVDNETAVTSNTSGNAKLALIAGIVAASVLVLVVLVNVGSGLFSDSTTASTTTTPPATVTPPATTPTPSPTAPKPFGLGGLIGTTPPSSPTPPSPVVPGGGGPTRTPSSPWGVGNAGLSKSGCTGPFNYTLTQDWNIYQSCSMTFVVTKGGVYAVSKTGRKIPLSVGDSSGTLPAGFVLVKLVPLTVDTQVEGSLN